MTTKKHKPATTNTGAEKEFLRARKPVAILIDGGYFLKRYKPCFGAYPADPRQVSKAMYAMALKHVENTSLYRILYYDCPPLQTGSMNPVSGRYVDFGKSNRAKFQNEFLDELRKLRKVAIRLGYLKERKSWAISPEKTKDLLNGSCSVENLLPEDVKYNITQKGVDIKIGLDIASLAYKRLVDRIILVSGDADFVPAAKLARREGIDFILDPMWNYIDQSLHEHIDGLKSTCPQPSHLRQT